MAEAPIEADVGNDDPIPEGSSVLEIPKNPNLEQDALAPQHAGPTIAINDRYFIDPGAPLPQLDSPSAKAYSVIDSFHPDQSLFALICTSNMPTRTDVMASIRNEKLDGLIPLVEWSTLNWSLLGKKSLALIYNRPIGGHVIEAIENLSLELNEIELQKRIVAPLIKGIKSLSALGYFHRAIRSSNVYFMDEEMREVVLGDCATSPSGFDQPMMYETIERSMTSPGGRGKGYLSDDIYALGVTITEIVLGNNHLGMMSDEELLNLKIEKGSYDALTSNANLPLFFCEPLQGMLHDNVNARWGLEEIDGWLRGRKQSTPKQAPAIHSEIPFLFEGNSFHNSRLLSLHLSRNRETAMQIITDSGLINWLRNNIGETNKADSIIDTIKQAALHEDEPQGKDEFIISKACMILDPQAPINYDGFTFMPDGFGAALAVDFLHRGITKRPLEVLKLGLPQVWYSLQRNVFASETGQQEEYAALTGYLSLKDPGFGFERCLYESNPTMACQSEIVANDYVCQIKDLLPALDTASSQVLNNINPIDRHIAAFIAVHFDRDIQPQLRALADPTEETATMGMLSLLAFLQWNLQIGSLYGLSSWVGGLLGPAINSYHSRSKRREIEKKIPSLVRNGSLSELFDLIENTTSRKTDAKGFEEATMEYAETEYEIQEIKDTRNERRLKAEIQGKQTTAVVSIVIAMIVISILMIIKLF